MQQNDANSPYSRITHNFIFSEFGHLGHFARKHYLDLKSVEETDTLRGIVPKDKSLPAMEKKDGRHVVPLLSNPQSERH
jgi:hypothetical protein